MHMSRLPLRSARLPIPILILFSLLFVQCGDGDADTGDGKTLRFAHFWSEPTQKVHLQKRIDAFIAKHPGVTVQLIDMSWDGGKQKLFAMFDGDQVPDVIELGSDWVPQFSESERLLDLTEVKGTVGEIPAEIIEPGSWQGKVYARPWIVAARGLFVNTDMLAEAGIDSTSLTTWEGILDASEAINTKYKVVNPPKYGFGANGADRNRLYKKILPFFWSNGGNLFDASGKPTMNDPKNIEALDFYLTLARNGKLETQKELDQLFLQGRVAFWMSGPWLVDRIAQENPSLNYRVIPMPSLNGKPGVGIAGGEYLAVNAESPNKDLAVELLNFLTSTDEALALSKDLKGGFMPADFAGISDPYLTEGAQAAFAAEMKNARMTPVHPQWLEIQDILEINVERALKGEMDASEALNNAQAEVIDLIGAV